MQENLESIKAWITKKTCEQKRLLKWKTKMNGINAAEYSALILKNARLIFHAEAMLVEWRAK